MNFDVKQLEDRVKNFYIHFNHNEFNEFNECRSFIDPEIKINENVYKNQLEEFKKLNGNIDILNIKINFIEDFAYVCIDWKNFLNEINHFRERWIKKNGVWYTRVCGLI